jgi:hypothetical protein
MRARILTPAIATVLSAVLLVLAVDGMGAPRSEIELSWDDGSAEGEISGQVGKKLAVGFFAPDTALSLSAIRIYIMDDGIVNPIDPELPSTMPFTVYVWRVGGSGELGPPANDGYVPYTEPYQYPEDAWVDVVFPEPIDLSNEEQFPNGKFYVGLGWEVRRNPVVGLDLDAPFSGETWFWDWTSWASVDTADAMIRAVVRDSSGAPVEARSWGQVKSEYR